MTIVIVFLVLCSPNMTVTYNFKGVPLAIYFHFNKLELGIIHIRRVQGMCPTIKPLSEDGFSLFQLDASAAPPIDHERAERLTKTQPYCRTNGQDVTP